MRRALPCLKSISVALAVSLAVSAPAQDAAPTAPAAVAAFRAGQQAFQREEFDAAISQFKAAISADARFAAAHCALGQTYMTLRRYAESVDALVQCKATTERQAAADASARAAQQREIDREIVELREAITRIRSGQVKTANEQTVMRIEERLRKLEETRNRGAMASGVPPAISYALGTAYLRVGSLELAERELREAIRQKADMGEAHNNLAAVYVGLGRWDEAAVQVRAAESAGFAVSAALKADLAARRSSGPAPPPAGPPVPAPVPAAPSAPPPVALSIAHDPVSCVPSIAFPRIEAGVVPGAASTAKVFFQTDASDGWYAVRMRADDERYAAVLPRPRSTRSFRYYIEATGEDTTTARTPERVVTVVDRAARCAGGISASVETASGIVVEPPAGAATGRPVPAGFSARGTVGDIGQFEMGTKIAVGAGVVLAGAAVAGAALAASKGSGAAPPTTIPARPDLGGDIALLSSDPAPGSTISVTGSIVSMSFRAVSPYAVPAGPARVQFSNMSGFFQACTTITGSHVDLRPNEPITVNVSGLMTTSSGFCGDRFDVRLVRVLLQAPSGPLVLQTGTGFLPDIPLVFTVVP